MPTFIPEIARRFRNSLLAMSLALAACDGDTTPIVSYNSINPPGEALSFNGSTSGSPTNDYRLGPNDRTRIIVYSQPDLSGEFVLDGQGVLAYPLLGRIPANGMTPSELQQVIQKKLDPAYMRDPSVSIEVASRRPFYVVGEVQKPGSFPFVTDMTVLNAIATAGGNTYRANMSSFYVKRMHDGRIVRVQATQKLYLQPGDTVMVRERYF